MDFAVFKKTKSLRDRQISIILRFALGSQLQKVGRKFFNLCTFLAMLFMELRIQGVSVSSTYSKIPYGTNHDK